MLRFPFQRLKTGQKNLVNRRGKFQTPKTKVSLSIQN